MATAAPPPATPPAGAAAGPLVPSEMFRNYNFLLRVESAEPPVEDLTSVMTIGAA